MRYQVFETSSDAIGTFEKMKVYLLEELRNLARASSGESVLPFSLGIAAFGPICLDDTSPKYGTITTTPKQGWADFPVYNLFK